MTFYLRTKIDPLTAASEARSGPTPVARSDAQATFRFQLRRYLDRQTLGQSFLISGVRGAGKTFMVNNAIDHFKHQAERRPDASDPNSLRLRPFLVRLHGPTLLGALEEERRNGRSGEAGAGGGTEEQGNRPAKTLDANTAMLVQIMTRLYRSLAEEASTQFRRRILNMRGDRHINRAHFHELTELAARFRLLLDGITNPSELREYWRRGGLLENGILFPAGTRRPFPSFASLFRRYPIEMDQGMLEITALATANAEYRKVLAASQSLDHIENKIDEDTESVGANIGGALSGILGALGDALTFKLSSTRTKLTKTNFTFREDLSVTTLERQIPVVIDRIRAAGLAPVFVVDELDKMRAETSYADVSHVFKNLKSLVTESAFFCFLTDRGYYEHRKAIPGGRHAYGEEFTLFSHDLFIAYHSYDLRDYLREMILPESGPSSGTQYGE